METRDNASSCVRRSLDGISFTRDGILQLPCRAGIQGFPILIELDWMSRVEMFMSEGAKKACHGRGESSDRSALRPDRLTEMLATRKITKCIFPNQRV